MSRDMDQNNDRPWASLIVPGEIGLKGEEVAMTRAIQREMAIVVRADLETGSRNKFSSVLKTETGWSVDADSVIVDGTDQYDLTQSS